MLKPLEDCNFYTEKTNKEKFVGRCREHHELRTRAYEKSLDAIDEVITLTRDKLARVHAVNAGYGPARLIPRP